MNEKIKCPFCGREIRFPAAPKPGAEAVCPFCGKKLPGCGTDPDWRKKLKDPADPAGYFVNFPPEDDGLK